MTICILVTALTLYRNVQYITWKPSPILKVTDAKEWYIEYLAEEFKKENKNHEEMIALWSQWNSMSNITFRSCSYLQQLMFAYFVNNDLLDDGKNMPYIPRYNTQNTVNAKQSVIPTFQVYLWYACIYM